MQFKHGGPGGLDAQACRRACSQPLQEPGVGDGGAGGDGGKGGDGGEGGAGGDGGEGGEGPGGDGDGPGTVPSSALQQ